MFFEKFDKAVGKVSEVFDKMSRIVLLLLTILCCANIIARLIYKPFSFTYDLMCLMATLAVSFSLPLCTMNKGHVAIDLVVNMFPEKVRKVIEMICSVISICIFFMVDYWLVRYTLGTITNNLSSITNMIPYWPFASCITLSFFMFTIVLINGFLKLLRKEDNK